MKLFPLVWSGLWRKPAEAILIALAVAAAFTLFGLMLGLQQTYRRLADSARLDRLDVYYRFPLSSGHHLTLAMREPIRRMPGVAAMGTDFRLVGYYKNPHQTGRIVAVDHAMRSARSELPITRAQWDLLFADPENVLVSRRMAQRWQLRAGDTFPFISPPNVRTDGSDVWEFHVAAVVPDKPASASGYILGNFDYIDQSLPPAQRLVMAFTVALTDERRALKTSVAIDDLFASSGTPTLTVPEKTDEEFSQRSGISAARVTWPVAGAGIFMILLVTANGIAQSVRERTPEFAVLAATGFPVATLCAVVVQEALVPCLLGSVLGIAFAAGLTQWPARYLPVDLTGLPKPTVSPWVAAWAIGFATLLALTSAVAPVLRLRRLSVVDALAGR